MTHPDEDADNEWVSEFTGDRAWGYQTKRLLFGNPKKIPLPRVRFLRLNRYKHYRHPTLRKSGWELVGPPRRPSWLEREGLLTNRDRLWEQESREGSIGVIWGYWWNPDQWSLVLPRIGRLFYFRAERNWETFYFDFQLLGVTLYQNPRFDYGRSSKAEMRKRLIERKKELGEWGG